MKTISPLHEHPAFAASAKKLTDLNAALAAVRGRVQEISVALAVSKPQASDQTRLDAALQFASTGQVVLPAAATVPAGLVGQRDTLLEQEVALVRAIATERASQNVLAGELSAQMCSELGKSHKALVSQYVQKLRELDALVDEENDLVQAIESAGYSVIFTERLTAAPWGRVGDTTGSPMFYSFRDLARYAD